ncbi:MAG: hypothetical protein ACRYG8_41560 [Janthinobacterium lividum]
MPWVVAASLLMIIVDEAAERRQRRHFRSAMQNWVNGSAFDDHGPSGLATMQLFDSQQPIARVIVSSKDPDLGQIGFGSADTLSHDRPSPPVAADPPRHPGASRSGRTRSGRFPLMAGAPDRSDTVLGRASPVPLQLLARRMIGGRGAGPSLGGCSMITATRS